MAKQPMKKMAAYESSKADKKMDMAAIKKGAKPSKPSMTKGGKKC